MLSIFHTLVELFGYPGDEQGDWFGLLNRAKFTGCLTAHEYDRVEEWLRIWDKALQSELRQLLWDVPGALTARATTTATS